MAKMKMTGGAGMDFGRIIKQVAGMLTGRREYHDWVIALLDLRSGDSVLEIGCGPGAAMRRILKKHRDISVVGADDSAAAVDAAWRRNARAVRKGRAMLLQADIAGGLPAFRTPLTRAVAVDVVLPPERWVAVLRAVRAALAPGGRIALAAMPRAKDATAADALLIGKDLRSHLAAAGFAAVKLHEKTLYDSPAVCVTGVVPAKDANKAP
jgi:cyclopropane fatty-acyl-phospholipid synthase-like methyltransferase